MKRVFRDITETQRLEGGREFEWDLVKVEQGVKISRSSVWSKAIATWAYAGFTLSWDAPNDMTIGR